MFIRHAFLSISCIIPMLLLIYVIDNMYLNEKKLSKTKHIWVKKQLIVCESTKTISHR